MNNPETLETLGIKETGQKQKTHTTKKSTKMSNTDPIKTPEVNPVACDVCEVLAYYKTPAVVHAQVRNISRGVKDIFNSHIDNNIETDFFQRCLNFITS